MVDGGETLFWVGGWCERGEEEAGGEELAGVRALCFGGKGTKGRDSVLLGRAVAISLFLYKIIFVTNLFYLFFCETICSIYT